jgi:hypothetical protein
VGQRGLTRSITGNINNIATTGDGIITNDNDDDSVVQQLTVDGEKPQGYENLE